MVKPAAYCHQSSLSYVLGATRALLVPARRQTNVSRMKNLAYVAARIQCSEILLFHNSYLREHRALFSGMVAFTVDFPQPRIPGEVSPRHIV